MLLMAILKVMQRVDHHRLLNVQVQHRFHHIQHVIGLDARLVNERQIRCCNQQLLKFFGGDT